MDEATLEEPENSASRRVKIPGSSRATYVDKTGQRFGKLTVVSLAGMKRLRSGNHLTYWLCRCECGTELELDTAHIKRRESTGCGCGRKTTVKDRTGERYGKITVLRREGTRVYGTRGRSLQSMWLCRCDCGNELVVSGAHLNAHRSWKYGCGCGRTGIKRPQHRPRWGYALGQAARNSVIKQYRYSAKHRGLENTLTDAELVDLVTSDCHYCGCPPSTVRLAGPASGEFVFNGIDRVDNGQGYVTGNVVPCCAICNRAKGVKHYEEFIAWCDQLAAYRVELQQTSSRRSKRPLDPKQEPLFSVPDTT